MKWKKLSPLILVVVALGFLAFVACREEARPTADRPLRLSGATRESETEIHADLRFTQDEISVSNFVIYEFGKTDNPIVPLEAKLARRGRQVILIVPPLNSEVNYNVGAISPHSRREGEMETNFFEAQWGDELLNKFFSDEPMGATLSGGNTTFRVFSPRAQKVMLCMFDKPYTDAPGKEKQQGETQHEMTLDPKSGVWSVTLRGTHWGKLYGYRVWGPRGATEVFDPNYIVADPYSKAMATLNISPQTHLTVLVDPSTYRWRSQKKYMGYDQTEYIIYEAHVRDLTMLSKDINKKGTYDGLTELGKQGGINHVLELGVNAIEFLPIHDFGEVEAPYKVTSRDFVYNTWNTYGRNHWGYMTSGFFAPESFYLEGKINAGGWIGTTGEQVHAFKRVVDAFHQHGIAVLMDVVYNHTAQYDRNPFKFIDKKYYYWLTPFGTDDARSGCGNDFRTCRPMSRRVLVDSTRYWVEEYRVDGFRFDLGTIIDWETYDHIKDAVYKVNPKTVLTAEPWMGGRGEPRDGGGYSPEGMARNKIAAWNDKTRPIMKDSLHQGRARTADLRQGVLAHPNIYNEPRFSVTYVESHDNETLSDIIRINNGDVRRNQEIKPEEYLKVATLTERQMQQNKLVILYLMSVQGPVMVHSGMEFARMKIVIPPSGKDVFPPNSANWVKEGNTWINTMGTNRQGNPQRWSQKTAPHLLDRDSYEKDNESNWLNWDLKKANIDLFNYYQGLIDIRKNSKSFGSYPIDKIEFFDGVDENGRNVQGALGYHYDKAHSSDSKSYVILVNGSRADVKFDIPEGEWTVIVDKDKSNIKGGKKVSGSVSVPSFTGMYLAK
jgi:pullulanase/glycogen debranching enzyme